MTELIDPMSGLTEQETACHDALQECYRQWLKLPVQHPDEPRDFVNCVHFIQGLLAMRVARRAYPKYWVDRSKKTQHLDHPPKERCSICGNVLDNICPGFGILDGKTTCIPCIEQSGRKPVAIAR